MTVGECPRCRVAVDLEEHSKDRCEQYQAVQLKLAEARRCRAEGWTEGYIAALRDAIDGKATRLNPYGGEIVGS